MLELVIDKFRRVDKRVKLVLVLCGIILGVLASVIFAYAKHVWLAAPLMLALALIAGGAVVYAFAIAYRIWFSAGVPKSQASDIISPNCFGAVTRHHLACLGKALVPAFVLSMAAAAIIAKI